MGLPTQIKDVLVTNGWYLELPGVVSGHFETLEGLQKNTTDVEMVDGGTNKKVSFGGQVIDYGKLTLTRPLQNNADDVALKDLADEMVATGKKINVTAVKMHKGQELFRVLIEGFRISSYKYPTLNVAGTEKFMVTYTAGYDDFDQI